MKPLILEGPDGIGKTTFANFLKQLYDNTKMINYTNKDVNDYTFWAEEYTTAMQTNKLGKIIMSRSFLSEILYADIFKREPRLTLEEEQELFNKVKQDFDIVILLPKNEHELVKRLTTRGDYEVIVNNILLITERYKELVEKYNLKAIYV